MPTGKVKWYDAEKGFGFLADDEGADVFLHANALPEGVTTLKGGTRVEFGVVEGRRGAQALTIRVLDPAPSIDARRFQPAADPGATSSRPQMRAAIFCASLGPTRPLSKVTSSRS